MKPVKTNSVNHPFATADGIQNCHVSVDAYVFRVFTATVNARSAIIVLPAKFLYTLAERNDEVLSHEPKLYV